METLIDTTWLPLLALAGFAVAPLAPLLARALGRWIGWVLALVPAGAAALLLSRLGTIDAQTALTFSRPWISDLNVNLSFYVDGLSLVMALVITVIGTFIFIYAEGYLHGDTYLGRFYAILLIFMAAMLTVATADNLLVLFMAWELTSISSFFLIGFRHEDEKSQKAALQALLVTGGGGLALLAGLILLALAGGSWEISTLLQSGDAVRSSGLYTPALILILLGAFTKSAQFPFHFWLPSAMAGPTPVSAYLHSATMVKAGVFLLARLYPILSGTDLWFVIVTVVGVITAVLGGWLAWQQTDLKRILAYSTVSALGTMVMLLGMGGKYALKAALLFLIVHSLYKGALFMIAGSIDHETGSRDVRHLRGLARLMPVTLAGAVLAALSMAGIPPLLGFISKELMYEATLEVDRAGWREVLTTLAVVTNVTMVAASAIILIKPFFGRIGADSPRPRHEAPPRMWLGPLFLGAVALGFGLASKSTLVTYWLLEPAVSATAGQEIAVELGLWHGFTPYLTLSGVTIAAGALLYLAHARLRPTVQYADRAVAGRLGPERFYDLTYDAIFGTAERFTRTFQNGSLSRYISYVLAALVLTVGFTLLTRAEQIWPTGTLTPQLQEIVIALVIIAATLSILVFRSRLAVVAALGVVGYGMALTYIQFGAPDLAMTQFAIETLTVILFVLILRKLPRFETLSAPRQRVRDGILAITVGILMTLLVLAATAYEHPTPVSDYFAANSYLLAEGRNVVNVILVDFRGMDTMMEITVLMAAAIGVFALLRSREPEDERE